MIKLLGKGLIKLVSYLIILFITLALFVYLTFPVDSLKKRVAYELENNLGYTVEIKALNFNPYLEFDLSEIRITRPGASQVVVDQLRLKPYPLSILKGDNKIGYAAEVFNGDIKGYIKLDKKSNNIGYLSANLNEIDSSKLFSVVESDKNRPRLAGNIRGEIELELKSTKKASNEVNGTYNLSSDNFSISNLRLESFTLPPYNNLTANLNGKIDNVNAKVKNLQFKNKNFDLTLYGTMPLPWKMKRMDKIDMSYKLLLHSTEAKLSFLTAFSSLDRDGSYGGKIRGTISKPKLVKNTNQ